MAIKCSANKSVNFSTRSQFGCSSLGSLSKRFSNSPQKKRSCNVSNYCREGRISYELVFVFYADSAFYTLNIRKIYILFIFFYLLKTCKKFSMYSDMYLLLLFFFVGISNLLQQKENTL